MERMNPAERARPRLKRLVSLAALALAGFALWRIAGDADRRARDIATARAECARNAEILRAYDRHEGSARVSLISPDWKTDLLGRLKDKDPWGNDYKIDPWHALVYSKGPDGLDRTAKEPGGGSPLVLGAPENADNIAVDYLGPLEIMKATVEVNPGGDADPAEAYDALHLFFSRRVTLAGARLDLVADAAEEDAAREGRDAARAKGRCLRFRRAEDGAVTDPRTLFRRFGSDGSALPAPSIPLVYGSLEDPASLWRGEGEPGRIYHSEDLREIVLVLPRGTSGSVIPGSSRIDLTGGLGDLPGANPFFKQTDGITGGVMSARPRSIEVHD